MKNIKLFFGIILLFTSILLRGQDTTAFTRHEFGVNAVGLFKQLISSNQSSTLQTLPYVLMYNYNFSKKTALRLGFGGDLTDTKTAIEGQSLPRHTTNLTFNLRAGVSRNFFQDKRVGFNSFVDGTLFVNDFKCRSTTTVQTFPNPITTQEANSKNNTLGFGLQTGFGVKIKVFKNLSFYTEVPVGVVFSTTKISDSIKTENTAEISNKSSVNNTDFRITAPVTLYLLLNFN